MALKYAKIIDATTNKVDVGLGTNVQAYTTQGMTLQEVEQGYDGNWYLVGHLPVKPIEKQVSELESQYNMPRVVREGIINNPSAYSSYNRAKAREIEDLAEQLREVA